MNANIEGTIGKTSSQLLIKAIEAAKLDLLACRKELTGGKSSKSENSTQVDKISRSNRELKEIKAVMTEISAVK
jgi:hypothetical protein